MWPGLKELLFAINQGIDIVRREFNAMAVGNGIGGASLDAITTENATRIIDIIDAREPFSRRNALRLRILGRLNVNTICGTGCGAEKTTHAFFEAVFITLQNVNTAVARLDTRWDFGECLRRSLAEHCPQGDPKALIERKKRFADFS